MGRFGLDFPLADFLTDAPDKAFLTGVTAGREVNTVTIDGVPCRHLVFLASIAEGTADVRRVNG